MRDKILYRKVLFGLLLSVMLVMCSNFCSYGLEKFYSSHLEKWYPSYPKEINQESSSTCWCWSLCNQAMISLAKNGYKVFKLNGAASALFSVMPTINDPLDFSSDDEYVIDYETFKKVNSRGVSADTMILRYGRLFDYGLLPVSAYPIKYPMTSLNFDLSMASSNSNVWVKQWHRLPGIYLGINPNDNAAKKRQIKLLIKKYGAIGVSGHSRYSSDEHYYNKDKHTMNSPDSSAGHEYAVIGWDDNFSKDNFNIQPDGDGAWICLNSYGKDNDKLYDYFDDNVFYQSYYDKSLNTSGAVVAEPKKDGQHVYHHDGVESQGSILLGAGDIASVCYKIRKDTAITDIGFWDWSDALKSYTYRIYVNSICIDKGVYKVDFPGYHSFKVSNPIICDENDEVEIALSSNVSVKMGVEKTERVSYIKPTLHEGDSFLTKTSSGSKKDTYFDNYCFRVKMYVDDSLAKKGKKQLEPIKPVVLQIPRINRKVCAKKAVTLRWNELKNPVVSGYEILMRVKVKKKWKNKIITVQRGNCVKKKIRGLKRHSMYYFKIRSYKFVNSSKIFSPWSRKWVTVKTK